MPAADSNSQASISRVLYAAAAVGSDNWGGGIGGGAGAVPAPGDLHHDVVALFDLLRRRRITSVLVGGVAMGRYIDARNTDDVDLIMSVSSLKKLPELKVASRSGHFATARFGTVRTDLLLTVNPLFRTVARSHTCIQKFREGPVRCATVQGLVILKLYALSSLYRAGDARRITLYEADLALLMQGHKPDLEGAFALLTKHLTAGELKDLRQVVEEITERNQRASTKRRPR